MYMFVDMAILGIALAMQRWWVLLVFAILLPLRMWNARREDKLLAEKFGIKFQPWRNQTWF
jgi:protein-S-isoprenylcysteine O-methyltransferase Ste14